MCVIEDHLRAESAKIVAATRGILSNRSELSGEAASDRSSTPTSNSNYYRSTRRRERTVISELTEVHGEPDSDRTGIAEAAHTAHRRQ